jgi:hypothetical protein
LTVAVVALFVLLLADGLILGLNGHLVHLPTGRGAASAWLWNLRLGLPTAGVVLAFLSLGLSVRDIATRPAGPILTRTDRRELLRQIKGSDEVDQARLPLARYLAGSLLVKWHMLLLAYCLALLMMSAALNPFASDPWLMALTGSTLVLIAVGVLLGVRKNTQVRRFLDRHPEAPQGEAGAFG